MHCLNLGILAHVDAGKTTLTERLLFDAGVLASPGSVDAGTTRTDTMALERRRGITIRSAVTSFAVGDLTVNLIDTPGHPDFIAEVERALGVLDGAVLVVSAVEGVQPQTVVIWGALQRMRVPTLVFVNKTDRPEARWRRVAAEVEQRLGAGVTEFAPVLGGSARTGHGVPALTEAMATRLPLAGDRGGGEEPAGIVFKIERDGSAKRVYLRMRTGRIRVRDRLSLSGRAAERITSLQVSDPSGFAESGSAGAGQIAVIAGLDSAKIGDTFGPACVSPESRESTVEHRFPTPVLETVVEPVDPTRRGAMFAALTELAEQDPLIALHTDEATREVAVRLYGEVQKQVIGSVLAEEYGVQVAFTESRLVCIERLVGTGASVEQIGTGDNPYLATVGLRVAPAPAGSGVSFTLDVEAGSMPPAFFAATEEGVRNALRQGLHGWAIPDCSVAITHSGYWARSSHAHQKFNKATSSVAADFRRLAPVVLMTAVHRAGTKVCEPVNRITLEVPTASLDGVISTLSRLGGVPLAMESVSGYTRLGGHLPTGALPALTSRLPDLTGGAGAITSELDHYRPVREDPPRRRRLGPDPLDRTAWFRAMPR